MPLTQLTVLAAAAIETALDPLFIALGLTLHTQLNAGDCQAAGLWDRLVAFLAIMCAFTVRQLTARPIKLIADAVVDLFLDIAVL